MYSRNWLDDVAKDLRHTGRMLVANPGFAAIAILTLALGTGANTAIFSVTNALLLRTLPVHDPQQLYHVTYDHQPNNASDTGNEGTSISYYAFEHLRTNNAVTSDLMAYVPLGFNKISVRTGTLPEEAAGEMVSGNFFTGLGVHPLCGRLLSPQDESTHASVVVTGYAFAVRRFGDACDAVGRPIYVKGVPFTIVGVAPRLFTGLRVDPTDVWIPFQVRPEFNAWGMAGKPYFADPSWWCILMIARLKPGVSQKAAEAALIPAFQRAAYEPIGGKPARGEKPIRLRLVPARGILAASEFQKPLLMLQIMVGFLLLIACGNVSVLLAVRNAARRREFSVCLALGGSRGRLLRQLFTEGLVLVFCGAVLGVLFALAATRILASWAELEISLAPDATVLLFTMLISAVVALIFGIGLAFGARRVSIAESLKTSSATAYRNPAKITSGKVITAFQLALCMTLVAGTGLLVRTLQNLEHVNVGFETHHLLVFGISPHLQGNGDAAAIAFYRTLTDKLRSLPGVRAVTLMGNRIGSGWSNNTTAIIDGRIPRDVPNMFRWNNVGRDFFTTLGIRLIRGRDFNDSDSQSSQPVAVVNKLFVQRFLQGRNPIGHMASYGPKSFTIIGVAADSKYMGLDEKPIPMAWFPYTQIGEIGTMHIELRTSGPAASVLPEARRAVAGLAPDLALLQPETQQAQFDETVSSQRLLARLSVSFAVLAMILVMAGLYGTISYSVTRRTSELGIRMALGAEQNRVLWMVLREGLVLSALGIAIGVPVALASSRLLASLLYGVAPSDPITIFAAALAILVISFLATLVPARRAASVDPMVALRYE